MDCFAEPLMGRGFARRVGSHSRKTSRFVAKTALLRRRGPGPSDKAGGVAKTLDHDRGQVLGLAGHAGAGAHGVALLMRKMRGRLALLQRASRVHHQFSEMHDAEIGRAEMFAGAVGDRALAVLYRCVLLRHALDAGVAPGLLRLAVDQIYVALV